MTRYLLDTGIASDFINCRLDVDERVGAALRRGHRIGISTPVLGELLAGIENSNDPERHRLTLWRGLVGIRLWPFDKAAAQEFGRVSAMLRRKGRPMQQVDIQSASIAFALGDCRVVSKDSDFRAIPGLDVEDWSQPET